MDEPDTSTESAAIVTIQLRLNACYDVQHLAEFNDTLTLMAFSYTVCCYNTVNLLHILLNSIILQATNT